LLLIVFFDYRCRCETVYCRWVAWAIGFPKKKLLFYRAVLLQLFQSHPVQIKIRELSIAQYFSTYTCLARSHYYPYYYYYSNSVLRTAFVFVRILLHRVEYRRRLTGKRIELFFFRPPNPMIAGGRTESSRGRSHIACAFCIRPSGVDRIQLYIQVYIIVVRLNILF